MNATCGIKALLARPALVLFMAAPVLAQDYSIQLHQPLKIDQRYKFTRAAAESTQNSMTAQERVLKSEKEELSIEMESVATVMAIDSIGRPTKESHIVGKLVRVNGAAKEPVLPSGTKVIAIQEGKKTLFEVGGKPAAPEVAKVLELAILITSSGPSDDEIFGTTERKKVGDSWSINEEVALKDFKERFANQAMGVEKISGKTTLQKVTRDGDTDVLHFLADLTAKLSPSRMGPFTATEVTMQSTLTAAIPADVNHGIREEGVTMTMTFKASGKPDPNTPAVQVTRIGKRTVTSTFELLK